MSSHAGKKPARKGHKSLRCMCQTDIFHEKALGHICGDIVRQMELQCLEQGRIMRMEDARLNARVSMPRKNVMSVEATCSTHGSHVAGCGNITRRGLCMSDGVWLGAST